MGSNMMRQAVPINSPKSKLLELVWASSSFDSRVLINAEGMVLEYVDANIITSKYDRSEEERMVSFESDDKHIIY
jgi:DNA-directed RNA polymerase subunit beta